MAVDVRPASWGEGEQGILVAHIGIMAVHVPRIMAVKESNASWQWIMAS